MILEGGDESTKPTLGRYEVEKELGRGAMGTVFLGKDPRINRTVAIKTMELAAEFDEHQLQSAKERFFREAETAGRLSHPNIVTIYDIGEEQDLAYIAMELLKGKDLSDVLREGQKPVSWCLNLVAQCAEALDYAHQQDVVHRDIKPENVMYDEATGEIKITDFGIARITASTKTKTGTIMGTPSYMSPEQLAGTHVDGRSDLFSLGVMMYEMISGQLPFEGDSMAALVFAITNGSYKDIRELREVPDCVAEIIDKALKKELDERYQNGADMAGDIRMCMQIVGK
jgi:serine/threonine-protein kinase